MKISARTYLVATGCAGAVGGIVPLVLQYLGLEPKLFNISGIVAVLASLFLGGVAGMIGTLVANSDTSDNSNFIHTVLFALICGIGWQATIRGSSDYLHRAQAQLAANDLRHQTSSLEAATKTKATNQISSQIQATSNTAKTLINQLSYVPDANWPENFTTDSNKAVQTIRQAAQEDPKSAVDGLEDIGMAARGTNQTSLTQHVLMSLQDLQKNPAAAGFARKALLNVSPCNPPCTGNETCLPSGGNWVCVPPSGEK